MKQFEVYDVNLDPTEGKEMKKKRPCVIVSPDALNANLGTVIIAPLTSTVKGYPSRVASNFAGQSGEVVLDQIRSVDKSRLGKKAKGLVDAKMQQNIKDILKTMFS